MKWIIQFFIRTKLNFYLCMSAIKKTEFFRNSACRNKIVWVFQLIKQTKILSKKVLIPFLSDFLYKRIVVVFIVSVLVSALASLHCFCDFGLSLLRQNFNSISFLLKKKEREIVHTVAEPPKFNVHDHVLNANQ